MQNAKKREGFAVKHASLASSANLGVIDRLLNMTVTSKKPLLGSPKITVVLHFMALRFFDNHWDCWKDFFTGSQQSMSVFPNARVKEIQYPLDYQGTYCFV